MAIAFAQAIKVTSSGTSSVTTGVTTSASGSIFARMAQWDTGINFTSITDSKTNTWVQMDTERTNALTKARAYYKENAVGGASHTFTFTPSSSADISQYICEITGGATSSSLDGTPIGNVDASSPFTSPGLTTTNANDLLWTAIAGNSTTTATHAESTGFTIRNNTTTGGPNWTGCDATRAVSATGTYNSSFTEAGATSSVVFIAAFKELAGGGGTTTKRLAMLGVG